MTQVSRLICHPCPRLVGILDVENAVAGDPLLDIAKTAIYPSQGNGPKLESLLEGYGELPPDGNARLRMYQIYHSLELLGLDDGPRPIDVLAPSNRRKHPAFGQEQRVTIDRWLGSRGSRR
jgi:hypothetical protein